MAASVYEVCKHGEKLVHSRGGAKFTRAIRKTASSMLSAASQLLLLIAWRSLRIFMRSDFHASMKSDHTNIRVNFVGKRRPVFLVACAYGAYNKHREQTTENTKYSVSIKGHDTKECILLYHVLFGWEDLWTEYGI